MQLTPLVSVLICTRNRADELIHALRSVLANDYGSFTVSVVDQSDNDDTRKIVEQCQVECGGRVAVRYIRTDTRGLGFARNVALAEATGEVVAFTDDDCWVPTDWVAKIAALFLADPKLMMLYGQVLMPDEYVGDPSLVVPCLHFDTHREIKKGTIFGMAANMAFRKQIISVIGKYDVVLGAGGAFGGGEDFDFTYRAQTAGLKIVAEPTLTVIHKSFRTRDRWKDVLCSYGQGDAAFYSKHARCGDGWARQTIWKKIVRSLLRGVVRAICGRAAADQWSYLKGFRDGLRRSRGYMVDISHRLYIAADTPVKAKA
ncbi:MAG: glycosyltransferase family 2 protein [Armatimonadetes bacterium]|nr:glycosyltransferase family 2 protein [Armatimonadota bacterium]